MKTPSPLDHENARRILDEAWTLFQQKGYRGVSVDELCAKCGLTKPTLYYYFRDKENLFVEVLAHRLRGFHEVIEAQGSLPERLERMAASILEGFETPYNVLLRDREHLTRAENLQRIRDAFHNELFGPLEALMQRGIAAGELRGDPSTLTLIFLGMINNFIGRAGGGENRILAAKLTGYFLKGAQNV